MLAGMKEKRGALVLLLCLVFGLIFMGEYLWAEQQKRSDLEITVYSSGIGVVKDTRRVRLRRGEGELIFRAVASSLIPESVQLRLLDRQEKVDILQQEFRYRPFNPITLLEAYEGKMIRLVRFTPEGTVIKKARLLNAKDEIYEIDGEIYLGYPGYKVLPSIPKGLFSEASLVYLYKSKTEGYVKAEISYLTGGLNWKADYNLRIDSRDDVGELSAWITVENSSGTDYSNARVSLVAGEIHRVEATHGRGFYKTMALEEKRMVSETTLGEYHIYRLDRRVSVADGEKKQISLIKTRRVRISKEYIFQGDRGYIASFRSGKRQQLPVQVFVMFDNSEKSGLGLPLPAGLVRVYQKDPEGNLQFIGEDRIGHTPVDETLRLQIGKAFDVIAERLQTDYRKYAPNVYETEWEIVIRNHKETDITVGVIEPMTGQWEVVESSHPYKKTGAYTLRLDVNVPAKDIIKVKYRVRIKQ